LKDSKGVNLLSSFWAQRELIEMRTSPRCYMSSSSINLGKLLSTRLTLPKRIITTKKKPAVKLQENLRTLTVKLAGFFGCAFRICTSLLFFVLKKLGHVGHCYCISLTGKKKTLKDTANSSGFEGSRCLDIPTESV
jgi:hypothetical protein